MVKLFAPSEKTLMAMINLANNDDFNEVLTHLHGNEIYLAQFSCQILDDLSSKRFQGGSGAITSFLKQVKEAKEALEKLRKKEEKKR